MICIDPLLLALPSGSKHFILSCKSYWSTSQDRNSSETLTSYVYVSLCLNKTITVKSICFMLWFFCVYVYVCLSVCMRTVCVPGAYRGQQRVYDLLKLALWMSVCPSMWVLFKNNQCSLLRKQILSIFLGVLFAWLVSLLLWKLPNSDMCRYYLVCHFTSENWFLNVTCFPWHARNVLVHVNTIRLILPTT